MGYFVCSTLHDPEGGLAVAAERLEKPPIKAWFVYATPQTSGETLDRISSYKWIVLRPKRQEDQIPNLDPIESDHVNALQLFVEATHPLSHTVRYIDGDRFLFGMHFFPDDVEAIISHDKKLGSHGFRYIGHRRSRKAFGSHTTPIRLTESIIRKVYSELIGFETDPASTSHTFSGDIAIHIVRTAQNERSMRYPHGKWLNSATTNISITGYGKSKAFTCGNSLGYETALARHREIIRRRSNPAILTDCQALYNAFRETGLQDETEFHEWPQRVELLADWLDFAVKAAETRGQDATKIKETASKVKEIDMRQLRRLGTREEMERYCRTILEAL